MSAARLTRLVWIGCFVALPAWLFADVLFADRGFVYRDAAHFYYPLFEYTQSEWNAGRVPLWNPYDDAGQPLLANPTSSVLYPGKLLFFGPLPFDWAYKLYIVGHVLWAAAGTYYLARRWDCSPAASAVAALSYAYGGNVLFQYCNLIFLCSASWLPLAALAGGRMLEQRSIRAALVLAVALTMMTLAGDPQLAYVAGLSMGLWALVCWFQDRGEHAAAAARAEKKKRVVRETKPGDADLSHSWQSRLVAMLRHRFALLALAGGMTALLSAVQVLPSAEFAGRSSRAFWAVPRSLYDLPSFWLREPSPSQSPRHRWYAGLLGDPPPGSHQDSTYEFSLGPWRLVECLWPNFSGQQFPVNRRWLEILPAEGAVWVPSLYLGLYPLLLAATAFRLRRASGRIRWLSWLLLLSVWASFGEFGLIWLARELAAVVGIDYQPSLGGVRVGDEVGGLYWLMNVALPGFAQFRFPAKLLVPASFAASMLAAHGWDRVAGGDPSRLRHALAILLAISLLGAAIVGMLSPGWQQRMSAVPADGFFGPIDAQGALLDLLGSFLQTALLSVAGWGMLWIAARSDSWRQRIPVALVLLLAMDLAVAQAWMIATAPSSIWRQTPEVAELIHQAEAADQSDDAGPYRVLRGSWSPEAWAKSGSPQRQVDGLRWDRATLFNYYHLQLPLASADTTGTLRLYDYGTSISPAARRADNGRVEFVQARRMLDALNVKYFILPRSGHDASPSGSTLGLENEWLEPRWTSERFQGRPSGERLPPIELGELIADLDDVRVLRNTSAGPRAWIVHQLVTVQPVDTLTQTQVMASYQQAMKFPVEQWIDLRQAALVEVPAEEQGIEAQGQLQVLGQASESDDCRVVRYEPDLVELEVALESPGLVVLADAWYPGWQLDVMTGGQLRSQQILRTNLCMRGAALEAGQHRLIYRYHPLRFYLGACLSGIAWTLLAGGWVLAGVRQRATRQAA